MCTALRRWTNKNREGRAHKSSCSLPFRLCCSSRQTKNHGPRTTQFRENDTQIAHHHQPQDLRFACFVSLHFTGVVLPFHFLFCPVLFTFKQFNRLNTPLIVLVRFCVPGRRGYSGISLPTVLRAGVAQVFNTILGARTKSRHHISVPSCTRNSWLTRL